MNNNFDRTKTETSKAGRKALSIRSLALLMFFVMLFTAIGSGSVLSAIAATGSAADNASQSADASEDAAQNNYAAAADEFDTEETMLGVKKDLAATGADADLAKTGDDTTYYLHIGVQSAFRTGDGIAFTYDAGKGLYYASYNLVKDKEYPMVICTTSDALGDGQKRSANQSVTTKNSSFNPDTIQFDYFSYNTNNYDGYDCFKFKTQTTQTVYFTFTTPSAGLVVRSSLEGVTPETPTESSKVYFAKPAGWTNAYVYFYSQEYWDEDKGTGSATSSGCLNYNGTLMTQDAEYTDYYSATIPDDTKYIAFADQTQSNYGNFHQGGPIKVAIKITDGDRTKDPVLFDATTPIYTPDTSSSISLNGYSSGNTTYYLSGTWSALPEEYHNVTFSQPTGGTITVNGEDHGPISVNRTGTFTVNVTPDHGFVFKSLSVGGEDVTASVSNGSYTGTMGTEDIAVAATFEYAGKVTNADLIDVLDGDKIMFYFGEPSGWNDDTYYMMNTNSTSDVAASATRSSDDDKISIDEQSYRFAKFCIASRDYYMGHWAGGMHTTPAAGWAYVLHSKTNTSYAHHTWIMNQDDSDSGANSLYKITGGTKTLTTTFPTAVYQGYTAPVATGAPGKSVLGLTNTIEYYVKDGDNYYEVEADDGYIDTSAFAVKDGYKLITVLKDGNNLRVVAATNNFNVVAPDLKTINIKSNNARLGTGTSNVPSAVPGQTVTITIHANMGAFASISVKDASDNDVPTTEVTPGTKYTFVMPSTNATVNLTFNDYTATSPFYYNSYETNGSPSSTRYGQRMTEGEINGEKFSYYHVEGRTGSDHLFTVSYGSPKYNSYNAYFEIWSGWESGGVKAQFYATDGNNLGDYANMTYDGKTDSDQKKKFKIAIPDGARKVQFKHGENTTGQLNLYEGNNGWYTKTTFTDLGAYDSGYNPVPVNFYENFNGEGKYTANFKTKGFNDHNATRGESHAYTKPKDLGTDSGDYYIVVLYSGKTYTINGEEHTVNKDPEIIWMPKLPGTEDIDSSEVNVYGKDGPIVIDWNNKASSGASDTTGTAYGYGVIADTKLYDSDGTTSIGTAHTDDGNDYESAKVVVTSEDSANIVVKTTIASDYRSKYYLKGWNINGVTYACGNNVKGVNDENAGSDGVYTMTYTIPAGTEDSAKIEITPIYYLTSSYKTTNEIETVTFFLEGYSTITEKWGDTPYIYPFYGNLNNVDNSFGVYPGQPMVFASGQYSVEVPVNKNVPIAKDPGSNAVKGITINNGYADHVHRNLVYKWSDHDNDQEHKQTYDYDDFYKIYEECLKNGNEHPNSIIFRIHDEETVFNRSQYGGGKSGQFASGTSKIDINTIATSGNGWELLTNRYGQAINLFGAHVTDPTTETTAATDTDNALYIVSTGYNANIAGDYGTMWKIYDGSGQLISNAGGRVGVPPSVLLLRGNSSGYAPAVGALNYPSANRSVDGVGSYKDSIGDYEAIYKALHDSSYAGKRVYITYEKDAQDTRKVTSGTGANRLDGRWYYTHSSDKVKSTIGIEYWDNSQNKWVPDTMSGITGSNTQCTAKFTDNNTTTSEEYLISSGGTYNFTATTHSGWKFDSWQIKYSDTSYDPIDTAETASMPATASYEIVARFVPTTAGDLTINHTLNKASTGEGTVNMDVKVYTDSRKTTLVTDGEKTGSRVYLNDTFINNSTAFNYVIEITLKTTPMYDGTVSEFTYDKFNSDNGITAETSPAALPGDENTLTTSTFTIPVSSLYNYDTLKTRELNYTSLIDETLHYYNFVYNLTTRGNVSKTYTSKGILNKTDYKKVVSDQASHTLDNSILVDKAPFESNFLKSNTLSKGEISYDGETHTYSATSTFNQNDAVPKYHVVFKLPYEYLNEGDSTATPKTKKYTVTSDKTYNADKATFDLLAEYNTFVTVNATSSAIGTQENVNKVTDSSDINHAGNNFITAPEELNGSGTTKYFQYWDIKKLKSDGTAGDDVAKIYYPDFHYRVYNNYYVEAVYSDDAADSWKHNYSEGDNNSIDCSVLYLGDSRNQWNDGTKADGYTTNDSSEAADMIYNDFIFHYTYNGQELKNVDGVEVGMILERATYLDTSDSNKQKWLTGSTSVNDMSYYRANYGGDGANSTESTRKEAIRTALNGNTALPSGTIKQQWQNSVLNNKNFTEQSYSVYSQYGQTVANDTITFAKDNTIDNYVYRAYAYIKGKDDVTYTLSDPVYFCMRYTSNLKYTE